MTIVPADIEDIARALAERSGTTIEEVLRRSVQMEARFAGIDVPKNPAFKRVDLVAARAIARRISQLPLRDARSPACILDEAWSGADDRGR